MKQGLSRYLGLSFAYGINRSILAVTVLVPSVLGASAANLGRLEILIASTTIAASLGPLGTGDSLMHASYRDSASNWRFGLILSVGLGAFIGGIVTWVTIGAWVMFGLALGALRSLQTLGQSRLRVDNDLRPLVMSAVATVGLAAVAFILSRSIGIAVTEAAALGLSAGLLGAALVAVLHYRHLTEMGPPDRVGMLRFGVPLSIGVLFITLLAESDRFLLQHFWSLDVVGQYGVTYRWVSLVSGVAATMVSWWTAEAFRKGPEWSRANWARLTTIGTVGIAFVAAGAAWPLSYLASRAFDAQISEFLPIVIWLEVAVVAFVPAGTAVAVLAVEQRSPLVMTIWGAAALTNIALNIVVIPRFSMLGAAVTTAVCYILAAATSCAAAGRSLRTNRSQTMATSS